MLKFRIARCDCGNMGCGAVHVYFAIQIIIPMLSGSYSEGRGVTIHLLLPGCRFA